MIATQIIIEDRNFKAHYTDLVTSIFWKLRLAEQAMSRAKNDFVMELNATKGHPEEEEVRAMYSRNEERLARIGGQMTALRQIIEDLNIGDDEAEDGLDEYNRWNAAMDEHEKEEYEKAVKYGL